MSELVTFVEGGVFYIDYRITFDEVVPESNVTYVLAKVVYDHSQSSSADPDDPLECGCGFAPLLSG